MTEVFGELRKAGVSVQRACALTGDLAGELLSAGQTGRTTAWAVAAAQTAAAGAKHRRA